MTDIHAMVRPEVAPLPPYNAGLSSSVVRERYGATHIARLASNENPYGTSPGVARALADVGTSISDYPDPQCVALRGAIGARCGVDPACITIGNGSEDLLRTLCIAFLSPGEWVLTQRPSFGLHEIYPSMMGARVELLALTPELGFDVQAWCRALARGPKVAMIANPSNPVGCMFDADAFARLVEAAPAHTLLVIDEAYCEYARHAPGFPDALAMLRARKHPWIVLRTFSKAWGLAGLRVGYGVASNPELVQALDRVRAPFNVNHAAQIAALAAWSDPEFMEKAVAETIRCREIMRGQLKGLGLRVAPSVANFLFVDMGRPNSPINEMLLAHGIITKPWADPGYESFIRVSIGTEADNARFVQVIERILDTA
jgi:histidinol-phosphate aminotransferase